jgi:hypothetical protein
VPASAVCAWPALGRATTAGTRGLSAARCPFRVEPGVLQMDAAPTRRKPAATAVDGGGLGTSLAAGVLARGTIWLQRFYATQNNSKNDLILEVM